MLAAGGGRPCRRHTGSVAANRRLCWAVSSRFIRVNPSPRPSIPHARQASSRYDLISHPPRTVGTRAGRGTERTEARAGVHQFSSEPVATSGHLAPAGAQPAGPLDMRAATGSVAPQTAPGRPPRAGQCSGDAAAVNTPVVPVTSGRRSRRSLHCRTAPAQVAFHRAPQLLLRRSSRAAARRMAPMPALACRSRWSPLQSRHSGHRRGCGCRLTRASQHDAAVGQSRRSGNRARRMRQMRQMRQMRRILPLHPEK